jgi:hypothetical protein
LLDRCTCDAVADRATVQAFRGAVQEFSLSGRLTMIPQRYSSTASLPICADLYGPPLVQTIVGRWSLERRLNDEARMFCTCVVVVRPLARLSAHVIFSDMCSTTSHTGTTVAYDIPMLTHLRSFWRAPQPWLFRLHRFGRPAPPVRPCARACQSRYNRLVRQPR